MFQNALRYLTRIGACKLAKDNRRRGAHPAQQHHEATTLGHLLVSLPVSIEAAMFVVKVRLRFPTGNDGTCVARRYGEGLVGLGTGEWNGGLHPLLRRCKKVRLEWELH